MIWTVTLTRKSYKALGKLPAVIQDLADLAIEELELQGPIPQDWDVLKTSDDEYRLRLNYRYRMRYRLLGQNRLQIEVFYIGHRKEAYR